jgi:hypothetical protein
MRIGHLVAEAVSVCCPFCGESQPDANGSEMWTIESFLRKSGETSCVSCDKRFKIVLSKKARCNE